jgi:hypothetical protein
LNDIEVLGVIVSSGFKSRPVKKGFFTFDGKRYNVDPSAKEAGSPSGERLLNSPG